MEFIAAQVTLFRSTIKKIHESPEKVSSLVLTLVLILSCILAFFTRLFSVLRFESVIHEFDPYFNYRSTLFLVENGFYQFHNWFDKFAWYPLGRIVGGAVYPGLMATSAVIYYFLAFLHLPVSVRNVCVFLGPIYSVFTCLATYFFTKEMRNERAGVVAAFLISIVPGYISRSVAGSYDYECISIFALIFAYYCWIKAVNTGSIFWGMATALSYFYMVSNWGAYVFIINLLPLHTIVLILAGRFTTKLYVAYSSFYILALLLSMQITFVGFQAVQSSEHMAAMGTFAIVQILLVIRWVRGNLSTEKFQFFMKYSIAALVTVMASVVILGITTGYISPFTGRFYALLDPTYAKEHIPIVASVSEHQPTTWASFFFDLYILVLLFPAGLYFIFKDLNDAGIFAILYGVSAVYFAGVMVRLILLLAPIMCIVSAVAISAAYDSFFNNIMETQSESSSKQKMKQKAKQERFAYPYKSEIATFLVIGLTTLLLFYVVHCVWVTSEAYSSPSIVLSASGRGGQRIIFDDFREAYWWLRQNTPEDAKVMSWWDYGYQITGMANRTVIVDNNTWNNTHIAQVGKAFALPEEEAIHIIRHLDVDYLLVIFGGMTGYASDDINKFLWMVRIGGSCDPNMREPDYLTVNGEYKIDSNAPERMLNCLLYKCCYYRFNEVPTDTGNGNERVYGFDRVRNVEIGNKNFDLQYIEEAFTSEHWIVRIYRVLPERNRE